MDEKSKVVGMVVILVVAIIGTARAKSKTGRRVVSRAHVMVSSK